MKKTLLIVLAALMLVSCIPIFASAAITLSRQNVEIVPPTVSPNEVNYGEGIANVVLTGGQLWYIDPDTGVKTEVAGHFEIRNQASVNPTNTGTYSPTLLFYPEDTETYGTVSSSLRNNTPIVSGEWPTIYIRGAYTKIVTPPAFTCDAGDDLVYYTSYTKTGGKVVDENGTDVTYSGQFYIDEAKIGGKNRYLYEDTYVTARWDDIKKAGYESSYYENVLVKVTRKTATLETAPSVPKVLVGTTYADALAKLTAKVKLTASKTTYDTAATYWVPTYPEGVTAETPLTADATLTVTYQNPATDDTFTAEVTIETYTLPLAVISELPTVDATGIKPGMKASALTLTGGKAIAEGTETEVAGTFSIVDPDALLTSGWNTVAVAFTPDDTASYEGTADEIRVYIDKLITTAPTCDNTDITAGQQASVLTLSGGEATEEGTFAVVDPEQVLVAGSNKIAVKFTPSAEGAEYFEIVYINVIVKAKVMFVDENGTEIVPHITIPYGRKMGSDLSGYLKAYLNVSSSFNYEETEFYKKVIPVGTHDLTVKTICDNPNYERYNTLAFKLTIEPLAMGIESINYSAEGGFLLVTPDYVKANGTFAVYVNDELVAEGLKIEGYKFQCDFAPETSGEYTVKVVYTPTESDPCTMADHESAVQVNLVRNISLEKGTYTVNGTATSSKIKSGDIISIKGLYADEIALWSIKDTNGNDVDLAIKTVVTHTDENGGITFETVDGDLTSENLVFTMPDCDLVITYKTQAELEKEETIANCDHFCHSDNPILQMFWKFFQFIFRLFNIQQYCDCGSLHYNAALFG